MSTPAANSLLSIPLTATKAVETFSTPNDALNAVALLTKGLAAGNEAAFREFHLKYFDRLYRFLLVVARGNEDEAQEALQQTLLRVVRYIRVFECEDTFWCWLKVIARSSARDAGRKKQRYASLLEAFALRWHTGAATAGPNEDNQLRDCLEDCLEELERADRMMLEAKYLEGKTIKELAAESLATEKAVESRLLRLRRQLRLRILKKLNSR